VLRGAIAIANWRGRDAEAVALTRAREADVRRRGEDLWLIANDWGSAIRYNGLGRYDEALAAVERVTEDPFVLGLPISLRAEFIEAAVYSGKPEPAPKALAVVAEIAEASGAEWALGAHARVAALCAQGADAEALHREAIERLGAISIPGCDTLARARLCYG